MKKLVLLLFATLLLTGTIQTQHRSILTKKRGAEPPSAINVPCIKSGTMATSITTFNVTCDDTAFGTPTAVMTWLTHVTTAPEFTGLKFGIGFATSSTDDWSFQTTATSGEQTLTFRRQLDDEIIVDLFTSTGVVDGEANLSTFIDDGVTYNQAVASSATNLFHSIFFGGADFSAKAGTISSNTSVDGTTESVSLGFPPHVILFSSVNSATNDTALTTHGGFCFGVAVINDGQGSVGYYSVSLAEITDVGLIFSNQYACAHVNGSAALQAIEVTAFGADTFTITTKVATGAVTYGFLAMNVGNRTPYIHFFDTQASTGNVAVTGLGVTPSFVGLVVSSATSANTVMTGNDSATVALSLFSSATNDGTIAFHDLDNADTTFVQTHFHTQPLWSELPTGSDFLKATFTSLDADGFTLNYATTVTGKKALAWGWN